MQKTKYFTFFYHSVLFFVPKHVRLNSTHYLIVKINSKGKLQNIATNHSADIDHQDFMKIYREYTKELYSFLTIDTTLPASDLLRFRKTYFLFIKMTVTDQIKILNKKIMQNEAQYDLDRKAANICALSSNSLDKCEYFTGEDLGLKPSTIEQAKFEYSPLGMSLSKIFKKYEVKSNAKSRSDFNYDNKYAFYRFYKGYGEFKEISLDSKYNSTILILIKVTMILMMS